MKLEGVTMRGSLQGRQIEVPTLTQEHTENNADKYNIETRNTRKFCPMHSDAGHKTCSEIVGRNTQNILVD